MSQCKPVSTPIETGAKLSKIEEDTKKVDLTLFKSIIGSLRYLTCTGPDILFVVGLVSRFMEHPSLTHKSI